MVLDGVGRHLGGRPVKGRDLIALSVEFQARSIGAKVVGEDQIAADGQERGVEHLTDVEHERCQTLPSIANGTSVCCGCVAARECATKRDPPVRPPQLHTPRGSAAASVWPAARALGCRCGSGAVPPPTPLPPKVLVERGGGLYGLSGRIRLNSSDTLSIRNPRGGTRFSRRFCESGG